MAQEKRALRFSVRAEEGEKFALTGRAITYNDETEIGGEFIERIAPGALDESLAPNKEIKALFNHNPDAVLGSRKNGTLSLTSNERGLFFAVALDKSNARHKEVYAMCKRGDIDGCSFGFSPEDETWDQVRDTNGNTRARRTLKKINMWEMSVVTFPAYQSTMVQARSVNHSAQIQRAMTAPPSMAALDAENRRKAQQLKAEIFRSADAIIIPSDWGINPKAECTPVFFTPEQKEENITRQLREKCDEIGRQIFKDNVREELGL